MNKPQRFDVIVAGAGLIGAAAACLFARQGLRVGLVEAGDLNAETKTDDRVSAVSLATVNLLTELAAWQQVASVASAYRAMRVWDFNSAAKISFHAADIKQPCLGYIVHNREMAAAMINKLRQNYQATIMDGVKVAALQHDDENETLCVVLTGATGEHSVSTRLLVGADGDASRVRELCGVQTRRKDFAQDAITATVAIAGEHQATAWQCFLETGPAALLPLADENEQGRCSLVWSCDRNFAESLMQLDDAEFCARLQEVFTDKHEILGDIKHCGPRRRFALGQHHADSYIAGRVALIGDAAHRTHPLAGLGANIGFLDAASLAQVVADAAAKPGGDIGRRSVLRRYERWRKGENELALRAMAGFKDLFGSRLSAARTVRSAGMNMVDALPPVKNMLAKYATGLAGDLPAVCIGGGGV